jgi:hypothetical protein
MSTKRKRDYVGTIVPAVATLINRCIANQKKYRLITEEEYEENPPEEGPDTLIIVVNKTTCSLITSFWGNSKQ